MAAVREHGVVIISLENEATIPGVSANDEWMDGAVSKMLVALDLVSCSLAVLLYAPALSSSYHLRQRTQTWLRMQQVLTLLYSASFNHSHKKMGNPILPVIDILLIGVCKDSLNSSDWTEVSVAREGFLWLVTIIYA